MVTSKAPEEWQQALCVLGRALRRGTAVPRDLLDEMVHLARAHWQALVEALRALRKQDWDRHLEEEASKSSRWLHSFTKPAEQQPLWYIEGHATANCHTD
jgi:hypothetical protein